MVDMVIRRQDTGGERTAMDRVTRVVSGPLALKMQRLRAARENVAGVDVTTLPLLAARLAGGFRRPASPEDVQPAIRSALADGGFRELERVRDLPGMVRAVQRTLAMVWRADALLDPAGGARLGDLTELDARVRAALPAGALAPPDLRDAALARMAHAPVLFGRIELEGLLDVDPVWRPLAAALADVTAVSWRRPCAGARDWFSGEVVETWPAAAGEASAVICADPQAEVVEALRWARRLMAGGVAAARIGIAATSPETWDEAMLVLSREAGMPLHFTHGVAALEDPAGQACAALADVLLRGLSQARVRRLLRRSAPVRAGLPDDWAVGLRRAAGLFTEAQWRTALAAARTARASGASAEEILLPRLALLAHGVGAAFAAGEAFLDGEALGLWRQALRAAPPEALELSLRDLRLPDGVSPGAAMTWGPAAHLAAAPRPFVRLLGLTGRAWPRAGAEDPLLPEHVLSRARLEALSRPEEDERLFGLIHAHAVGGLVLSRSRRSAEGALLAPSRLFPAEGADVMAKVRTPDHAFSEADRLLARPSEARDRPALSLARAAWRGWLSPDVTAWDGQVPAGDPVVRAALGREQSATSLRRLLRDPLGFVWRYALGWRPAEAHADVLALDRAEFGELVHELLRRTVSRLEPTPGLNRATAAELAAAIEASAAEAAALWPAERPVPPSLLWAHTVDEAARMALAGLAHDQGLQPGTRSWSEVSFGTDGRIVEPWTQAGPVELGGLQIGGRIDRLDLRGDGAAARVTDYKTGAVPKAMARVILGGGTELQRVIYAAAVRRQAPEVRRVVSRLVYLRGGPAEDALDGDVLDQAITDAARFIETAAAGLAAGAAVPGPDARETFNPMRLALPADLDGHQRRKARALAAAAGELPGYWGMP